MRFTVTWHPRAEQQLGELWLRSPNRQQFAEAADAIDVMIAENPLAVGESRVGIARVLFVGPLAVTYDVFEADRRVVVLSVWLTRR